MFMLMLMHNACRGGKTVGGTQLFTVDHFMALPAEHPVFAQLHCLYYAEADSASGAVKLNQMPPDLAVKLFGPFKGRSPMYDALVVKPNWVGYSGKTFTGAAPLSVKAIKALATHEQNKFGACDTCGRELLRETFGTIKLCPICDGIIREDGK